MVRAGFDGRRRRQIAQVAERRIKLTQRSPTGFSQNLSNHPVDKYRNNINHILAKYAACVAPKHKYLHSNRLPQLRATLARGPRHSATRKDVQATMTEHTSERIWRASLVESPGARR